jgi:osmoprotectant transport system substrate-binding protein
MSTRKAARSFSLVLIALALIAASCGGGDDETTTTAASEGTTTAASGDSMMIADNVDLSGIAVTVGSKDFTEQLVLGELMVEAFKAAGADVTDKTNTGGTAVAREALLNGDIDVYMEYNGTGWAVHLAQPDPSSDPVTHTENVRAMDKEENNIDWIGRSPFNDTYGFATGPDLTASNGGPFDMQGMADYLAANPDATVCMESEFPSRDDGLILFENATGYEVPESQTSILDTNVIYNETANGNCDFGEIFTTDGRISYLDLSIVEDPGIMILYNVSMTMRDEVYQEAPEQWDKIADMLLSGLDNATMAELNKRVSVDGEDPSAVARDYLTQVGLI